MLNSFKRWLSVVGFKPQVYIRHDPVPTTVEDLSAVETKKRIDKEFAEHSSLINARALRPHSYDCEDNLMCTKDDCWKFIPDQIIGDSYLVDNKLKRVNNVGHIKKSKEVQ